jgi:D-amino-acid dehydrogenase
VPSHSIPLAAAGVILKSLKWMANPESPLYIKPRIDLEFLSWMWRFQRACREKPMRRTIPLLRDLSRASLALHTDLAAKVGMDGSYTREGLLMVYRTREGFEGGIHEATLLTEYGVSSDVLDAAAVRRMVPAAGSNLIGGVHYQEDAHLEPYQFVQTLAKLATQNGVKILPRTEVLGFETSGRKVSTVRTTRGDFKPDQVVLASGSWSSALAKDLNLNVHIQPAKGYSVTVQKPDGWPSIPLMLSEAKVGVTPMRSMLRFAGTLELAGMDFSINQRRVAAIRRAAREFLPETAELELIEIWRGLRPCTPDGLPIIARSKSCENLIVAAGHGMLGMSLGPITGKLVSQIASGQTPEIELSALTAERFQ